MLNGDLRDASSRMKSVCHEKIIGDIISCLAKIFFAVLFPLRQFLATMNLALLCHPLPETFFFPGKTQDGLFRSPVLMVASTLLSFLVMQVRLL